MPEKMLVVGGGIIGLEMACVYSALGSEVSVVELTDALMPGTDPDLLRPFNKIVKKRYDKIMVSTKVTGMRGDDGRHRGQLRGQERPFRGRLRQGAGGYRPARQWRQAGCRQGRCECR